MRVIICGGRNYDDAEAIRAALDSLHRRMAISVLIHGSLPALGGPAEAWARDHEVDIIRYPANWSKLGKLAETRRNAFMLADSRADAVLAFPGGRHTADLVRIARENGVSVIAAPPAERPAMPRRLQRSDEAGPRLTVEPAEEDRWMQESLLGTACMGGICHEPRVETQAAQLF